MPGLTKETAQQLRLPLDMNLQRRAFGVQTDAYFSAERRGRTLRMMPFRISHQSGRGISTTRGSERNSPR
jgi:lipase chaperone LimK